VARGLSAVLDPAAFAGVGTRHELLVTTVGDDGSFELAIVRRSSGEAVGTVALFANGRESIEISHIWVVPPFRGYGAGSEAAQFVVGAAAEAGFERIYAWAHPGLGLSVYFWIRMGLRPQHGEGPNDGLRFTRALGLQPVG
jgi:GNAT superfamily N-acetyltransferase